MLKSVLLIAISLIAPVLVLGQGEPAAYTEKSKVVPTGEQLHLYGVPTRSIDGNIQYLDLLIQLEFTESGELSSTATVLSEPSPQITSKEIVPGTYRWGTVTCEIITQATENGRTEAFMRCGDERDNRLTATLFTGPVKEHPLTQYLSTIEVDKIPASEEFTWGVLKSVGGPDHSSSGLWRCFYQNDIISVKQIGNLILLANYHNKDTSTCGADLEKFTPSEFE